jgi:hypothetical protein
MGSFHVQHKCLHSVWYSFPDVDTKTQQIMGAHLIISGMRLYDCPWCGGETHKIYPSYNTVIHAVIPELGNMCVRQQLDHYHPMLTRVGPMGYHSFCACPDPK